MTELQSLQAEVERLREALLAEIEWQAAYLPYGLDEVWERDMLPRLCAALSPPALQDKTEKL